MGGYAVWVMMDVGEYKVCLYQGRCGCSLAVLGSLHPSVPWYCYQPFVIAWHCIKYLE